ncbi:MAG: uracil-DNA glycosylase [Halothiobacillaceae bacterium]
MTLHPFVHSLAALRFEHCFNPYSDRCEVHDLADAPRRRAAVLSAMLRNATAGQVDSLWIGRDLGYRGGRRTGLALTDDVHLDHHVRRWGVRESRLTKGIPVAERTASVIWQILDQIEDRIFLWNVFPLHPYEPDDQFSNRAHNASERRAGEALLQMLVELIRPKRLVAIGNDAASAARRVATDGLPIIKVRHPSYGGQTEFIQQVTALYGVGVRQSDLF